MHRTSLFPALWCLLVILLGMSLPISGVRLKNSIKSSGQSKPESSSADVNVPDVSTVGGTSRWRQGEGFDGDELAVEDAQDGSSAYATEDMTNTSVLFSGPALGNREHLKRNAVMPVPAPMPVPASLLEKKRIADQELARNAPSIWDQNDFPIELQALARQEGNALGEGSYGKVFLFRATCGTDPNAFVAVKVMNLVGLDPQEVNDLRSEARLMKIIGKDSEYVCSLIGYPIEHTGKLFLVMPYQNAGDFMKLLDGRMDHLRADKNSQRKSGGDQSLEVALWFQVVKGVADLHKKGIIHMDLKPENVMLNRREQKWHATVIDLGIACRSEETRQLQIEYPRDENEYGPIPPEEVQAQVLQRKKAFESQTFDPFWDTPDSSYVILYNKDGFALSKDDALKDHTQYPVIFKYYKLSTSCGIRGTPGYVSPETFNRHWSRRSFRIGQPQADIWALGTMLYFIASYRMPPWIVEGFKAWHRLSPRVLTMEQQIGAVKQGLLRVTPQIFAGMEQELADARNARDNAKETVFTEMTRTYDADNDEFLRGAVKPEIADLIRGMLRPFNERLLTGDILQAMPRVMAAMGGDSALKKITAGGLAKAAVSTVAPYSQKYIDMVETKPSAAGAMFLPPACIQDGLGEDIGDKLVVKEDCIKSTLGRAGEMSQVICSNRVAGVLGEVAKMAGRCVDEICTPCCKCSVVRHSKRVEELFRSEDMEC